MPDYNNGSNVPTGAPPTGTPPSHTSVLRARWMRTNGMMEALKKNGIKEMKEEESEPARDTQRATKLTTNELTITCTIFGRIAAQHLEDR
uniref:Uncharacterized protein n=1 Tax=Acrobeloides nanus TaxID=290746 RepID=A0A914CI26_9BILA